MPAAAGRNKTSLLDAQRASHCHDVFWLFILSIGGRTGSTTVLRMVNELPGAYLSGENGGAFYAVFDALQHPAHPNYAWFTRPDRRQVAGATCAMLHASIRPEPGEPAVIRGFKEIRYPDHADFFSLFPRAKLIVSYRRDEGAQAKSTFGNKRPNANDEKRSHDRIAISRQRLESIRQRLPRDAVLDLAVEDFSAFTFNRMARWIGYRGCRFQRVAQMNTLADPRANDHPSKRPPATGNHSASAADRAARVQPRASDASDSLLDAQNWPDCRFVPEQW